MDFATILTSLGTAIAIIGFVYAFLRNFKTDVNSHIDKVNSHIDKMEQGLSELTKEMKEDKSKMDQRVMETNKRMDGVYHILLKRTEILKGE